MWDREATATRSSANLGCLARAELFPPRLPALQSPFSGHPRYPPAELTHSLGRHATAAAPWGRLALLQAQPATPARRSTGLLKAVRASSQEPALLLPGKAAAPPPPPNAHPLFPSQPASASPSLSLRSLGAQRPGFTRPEGAARNMNLEAGGLISSGWKGRRPGILSRLLGSVFSTWGLSILGGAGGGTTTRNPRPKQGQW